MQWKAEFLDGAEEKGSGLMSQIVYKNRKKIKTFEVTDSDITYSINLQTGSFTINDTIIPFYHLDWKYQLIYAVIKSTDIIAGQVRNPYIKEYILGWQTNISKKSFPQGRNYKIILHILPEGKYYFSLD